MLILAGVSLNAIVGDNGIISNAQNATMKNSMAVLEEFLQEQYVGAYDETSGNSSALSKIDVLRTKYPEYFYSPTEITGLSYILNKGNMYFLVQKENLPSDLQEQLRGGDAGDKSYNSYSTFVDVYGVTSNLKVYYCANGLESVTGTSEILKDDPTRVAINSSNGMASFLKDNYDWIRTDDSGNILAENLDSLQSLIIENTTIDNLSDLYNFSSLEKLEILNTRVNSLKGVGSSALLKEIYIENSTVGDMDTVGNATRLIKITAKKSVINSFDDISNSSSLISLLIENSQDEDVAIKIGNALKNSKMTSLNYLGIYNSSKVKNINNLNDISSTTKGKIKYLYLYNNGINTDVTINTGFSDLVNLTLKDNRSITTSITIKDMPKMTNLSVQSVRIKTLNIYNCTRIGYFNGIDTSKLENIVITGGNKIISCELARSGIADIDFLSGNNSITYLNLEGTINLVSIEGLRNNSSLITLKMSDSKIGNGTDTTVNENIYTHLGKSDNETLRNALAPLDNNTSLTYFDAANCKNLGYISYLKNCPLTELYLSGCINILGIEFSDSTMKAKIAAISNKSVPAGRELSFLSASTTSVKIAKNTQIKLDEFQSLKDLSQLKILFIGNGCTLVGTNDIEIPAEDYNTEINSILSGLTKLQYVQLGFANLTEITFVKGNNANNINQLVLTGTKVGTHTGKSGTTFTGEYENGLKLLNTYCPNLKTLALGESEYVDFTKIQIALNKLNDENFRGLVHGNNVGNIGLSTTRSMDVSSLANCTELKYFICNDTNRVNCYDLSGCTKLEKVYYEYACFTDKITLPNTSLRTDSKGNTLGYTVKLSRNYYTKIVGGGAARSVYIENAYSINNTDYWKNFESMRNSTFLEEVTLDLRQPDPTWSDYSANIESAGLEVFSGCNNLKKFTWYGRGHDEGLSKCTDISALTSCKNLEEINFTGTRITAIPDFTGCTNLSKIIINDSLLNDIRNLSKLTGLEEIKLSGKNIGMVPDLSASTKLTSVTITNSNLVDISNLSRSKTITYLDLQNNSISNLTGVDNLTGLTYLNLNVNSVKGTALSGTVDNIAILNSFKNKISVDNIDLRNNKFDDGEKSQLSWIIKK